MGCNAPAEATNCTLIEKSTLLSSRHATNRSIATGPDRPANEISYDDGGTKKEEEEEAENNYCPLLPPNHADDGKHCRTQNKRDGMGVAKRLSRRFSFAKRNKKEKSSNGGNFKAASFMEVLRYATSWDWVLLVVGVAGSVIVGAMQPLNSLVFRGITDVLMRGEFDYHNGTLDIDEFSAGIVFYVWGYFLIGLLTFALSLVSTFCFFTLCERQVHHIRKLFFFAILNQNMSWFDHNEVGALTQKMSSGIEQIKSGLSDKCAVIIQAAAAMVSGVVVGFTMSWQMTLVMLLVAPFVMCSIFGSARAITKSLRTEMEAYASAGAVADEVLGGIRTVAAFNAQYFEINRYEKCLKIGRKMGVKKAISIGFFSGIYLFILFAAMGVAFWYGTNLVFDGNISPGTVFGVFWAVLIGSIQMGQAIPQVNAIVSAKMAAGEILDIIDREPELDCRSDAGIRLESVKGRLDFCNIRFHYPSRPDVKILNGVSFSVEAGQSVALVGHSGCGKSTIISLLMRYYDFRQGSITVDDVPLRDINIKWLRNTIGIVSQEPVLFAATVEMNLRMGKEDVTMEEMIEACRMANAHEFICNLPEGYKTPIGEGGVKLSGGQKQRLAIARALVRKPKILLLDEATSALDTESEQIVQQALDQASSGRTTITIAHRLSTIRNADKIIVFDHGEIMESGSHDELLRLDGVYRQLVMAQEIVRPSHEDEFDTELTDDEDFSELSPARIRRSVMVRRDSSVSSPDAERMARQSNRIRKSMTSVRSSIDMEFEPLAEELIEEGTHAASVFDILRFARSERWLIAIGLVLALIMGAAWPAFSIIYGQMFKALSNAVGTNEVDKLVTTTIINSVMYVALGVVAGLTTFGSGALLGIVGERLTMRLRMMVFRNLMRQDGSFYDGTRNSVGKLTTRLAVDAPNVQAAIDQRLSGVLQGIVSLIFGMAVAFYFGWNVAPMGLATALLLVLIQTSVSNYLKRRGVKDVELAENASRIATESIEYVKTVQALTRQQFLYDYFCEASKKPHRLAIVRGAWQSFAYALNWSFVSFNFSAVYLFGMYMVRGDFTTPFVIFQVVEALNMASITIMRTATYFPEFVRAKLSAGLMFAMINRKPKIDSLSDAGIVTPLEGNIEANGIYFSYPNRQTQLILHGLTLRAPFGKTVALVGPSGCGKSTIIQLLERYYDVLSGVLCVDGTDIRRYNIRHLRNSMALVGQEPTLFNLTVRENITYGLGEEVTDEEVIRAAKLANIHEFVDSLPEKYSTSVGAKGGQLSGGQKQRIAIARAIIRNPKILLLDEATSALDTESEKIVQEAIDRAREGRTCLVIAHRLSTIQHADLIVVIRDGRVFELGTHQQLLMRKGLYYRLVERQSK